MWWYHCSHQLIPSSCSCFQNSARRHWRHYWLIVCKGCTTELSNLIATPQVVMRRVTAKKLSKPVTVLWVHTSILCLYVWKPTTCNSFHCWIKLLRILDKNMRNFENSLLVSLCLYVRYCELNWSGNVKEHQYNCCRYALNQNQGPKSRITGPTLYSVRWKVECCPV